MHVLKQLTYCHVFVQKVHFDLFGAIEKDRLHLRISTAFMSLRRKTASRNTYHQVMQH